MRPSVRTDFETALKNALKSNEVTFDRIYRPDLLLSLMRKEPNDQTLVPAYRAMPRCADVFERKQPVTVRRDFVTSGPLELIYDVRVPYNLKLDFADDPFLEMSLVFAKNTGHLTETVRVIDKEDGTPRYCLKARRGQGFTTYDEQGFYDVKNMLTSVTRKLSELHF